MPVFSNRANTGSVYGNNGVGYGNNWNYSGFPQPQNNFAWGGGYSQQQMDVSHYQYYDYVSGRAGADAYQMPPNVNKVVLYVHEFFLIMILFRMLIQNRNLFLRWIYPCMLQRPI